MGKSRFSYDLIFAEKNRQYSNFSGPLTPLHDFSEVIDHTETISAGSLTTLKRFQPGLSNRRLETTTFLKKEYPAKLFHRKISTIS
jgi:hypothetical protein